MPRRECKLRPGATLVWSDLKSHQHDRLRIASAAGALAVIAFSDATNGIEFIDYANALRTGWGAGQSFGHGARIIAAAIHWPISKDQPAMNNDPLNRVQMVPRGTTETK